MASQTLMEKIVAKQKQIEAQRNKFWKPPIGRSTIRILPSWIDDDHEFYKEVINHYNVGPNERTIVCLEQFGEKCPVCFLVRKLSQSNIAQDQERAYRIRKQNRVLVNILLDNAPDGAIKIWSMSSNPNNVKNPFSELISYFSNTASWGDFTDPEHGYNFDITAAKKRVPFRNGNVSEIVEYVLHPQRESTPIGRKTWADELYDLDDEVNRYKLHPDEIIRYMKGLQSGDDDNIF